MKIYAKVLFRLEMVTPGEYSYKEEFYAKNFILNDLQHTISCCGLVRKVPCEFKLSRFVLLYDERHRCLTDKNKLNPSDEFTFIVASKLPYFADLQQYLLKNSWDGKSTCQNVQFKDMAQFNTKKPIFYTGPYEHNGSITLPDAPLAERPLMARPLKKGDVVLDLGTLNQLYPRKLNKSSKMLLDILNKTTENVRVG